MKKLISKKWFFEIIQKSNIIVNKEVINSFYNSIPSSYISYKLGYLKFEELYKKETENVFPLLKETVGQDIWGNFGADKKTVQEFIDCVAREKEVRERNGDWAELKKVIYDRISLYPEMFDFNKTEVLFFEMTAEESKKNNIKEEEKKK